MVGSANDDMNVLFPFEASVLKKISCNFMYCQESAWSCFSRLCFFLVVFVVMLFLFFFGNSLVARIHDILTSFDMVLVLILRVIGIFSILLYSF